MDHSLPSVADARHRLLPEKAGTTVKADVRKAETVWRQAVGQAIDDVRQLAKLSLKEFAGAVERDERQVSRWITGVERPQFDAIFAVERLRQPMIVVLAELAGAEVETVVRVRRTA